MLLRMLRFICPPEQPPDLVPVQYQGGKIRALFGEDALQSVHGLSVIDWGCGQGHELIELARAGADVLGIDINERSLDIARRNIAEARLPCRVATSVNGHRADLIVCLDCFEHFAEPARELYAMHKALIPGGRVLISFGPPWKHPFGHHQPLFPWGHLILPESLVMAWRRSGGRPGHTYAEIGLNRMTVGRFRRLVRESGFTVESLEALPIRRLRWLHGLLPELTTSVVQARLRKPY